MEPPHPKYMTAAPDRYALLKAFARENRNKMTPSESLLWEYLKNHISGHHFRRQHIIGDYIVDFACLSSRLIVEIDGGYHSEPRQAAEDALRTKRLTMMGYRVIRFSNEQITSNIEEVITAIKNNIKK